uniref:TonB-dependent receptor n=1 Tax=Prevotella sp. GTC17254 TaxID=3236794 RepID=A0AB33IRM6_9BACT
MCRLFKSRLFAYVLATLLMGNPLQMVAQQQKVSLKLHQVSLKKALSEIEKRTQYKFSYRDVTLDGCAPVTFQKKDVSVAAVLAEILGERGLEYKWVQPSTIIISVKPGAKPGSKKLDKASGMVTDAQGDPVIGAIVQVVGKNRRTTTDLNGKFVLDTEEGEQLEISYVGFQTVRMRPKDNMSVVMQENMESLDEVVVVGYGTQRKRDLTGSIAMLKGDDMKLDGLSSVGQALGGKAAGLYVRQNSAQPGGGIDILVRGAGSVNAGNDPLYIVDGFPIAKLDQPSGGDAKMDPGTQSILNFLNPNDIESIEVLKDASATSIYGARAANGVVLITTKRGKTGSAKVSYSYDFSYQKYSDMYDLLSLKEWMQIRNDMALENYMWNNQVAPYGKKTLAEASANPYNGVALSYPYTQAQIDGAGEGTDWLGLITRNGHINEHNINLQGGSENTQYMLSFNYFNQKGIIKNSGLSRYTLKTNIDQGFLKIFKAGLNLTMTRINNDNTQLGGAQYENSGIIRSAIQMSPEVQAYDAATGTYPVNPLLPKQPNPYSLLTNTDQGRTNRFIGNVYVEARPMEGLVLRGSLGVDHAQMDRKTYQPRTTVNGNTLGGVAYIYNMNNDQYLAEATATYHKTLGNIHNVNLMVGGSYEEFNYDSSELGNNNFLTDVFLYNSINSGTGNKIIRSTATKNKMESYFMRASYVLLDRYLFTGTMRADGASVFAKNRKWGYFPSVALGWIVNEESFLKPVKWLSNLKLRLSWGQTGNADIGTNAFASFVTENAYVGGDHKTVIGVKKGKFDNPDLKWETTTEWNLGLDFGFLKGRISGSIDVYQRTISDLLNYRLLNSYQELPKVMSNIGKTQGRGIEVMLNTRNIETKNFSWSTNLTFTMYRDKWKERTPDWKPAVYEGVNDPIRAIYSRVADHVLQTGEAAPAAQPDLLPGQMVIKDLDGYKRDASGNPVTDANGRFVLTGAPDGKIDDADTKLIGSRDPGWLAGINNVLRYKDFELSFMFNGMFDRKIENPTMASYGINSFGIAGAGLNGLRTNLDRWTPTRPSTTMPSAYAAIGRGAFYTMGDYYYEDAWFVRLQNVSLSYNVPRAWLGKINFVSSVRLHLSANNLFVITPYNGLDPETDAYAAAYPNAKTYSFGVNITF